MSDNAKKKNIGIIALGIILLVGMGLLLYPHIRNKIQLKQQLELGQKCLAESDYDQAIEAFRAAEKIDPHNVDAQNGLAEAYLGIKNYVSAIWTYRNINEKEKVVSVYNTWVDELLSEEDYDEAVEILYDARGYAHQYLKDEEAKFETRIEEVNAEKERALAEEAEAEFKAEMEALSINCGEIESIGYAPDVLADAEVGDHVSFGTYEQDSDNSNGPEEIEWIVIDKNDGKALLLSRYALDARAYNDTFVPITWENCTLRSWLNNDFCNSAFSTEEQELIFQNVNENADSFDFYPKDECEGGAEGGNDTEDRVFLLSIHEVQQLFGANLTYDRSSKNDSLICYPTKQALINGARCVSEDEYKRYWRDDGYPAEIIGATLWWLRSPGSGHYYSTVVYKDGELDDWRLKHEFGDDASDIAVRPAIYLEY